MHPFFYPPDIHSPYWAPSFWSVSFCNLLSSLCCINDPWGLAGCEQKLVTQDGRNERGDPSHVGFFSCCMCMCVCPCCSVGGCQRRLAWHGSQFQRLPRKWGGNNPAKTILKSDRESDFGEFTASLRRQAGWQKKKRSFIYKLRKLHYHFMPF